MGTPAADSDAMKNRRRTTKKTKRPSALKVGRHHKQFSTNANTKIALLEHERDDALEQQKAMSEVLRVISRSTFDLQTVFDTLVKSAARLCRAEKANITLLRDGRFQYVAGVGFSPELMEYMQSLRLTIQRGSISGRSLVEGQTVHVPDVLADPEFAFPEAQKLGGFRTALGVPLMREGAAIGTIFLSRATIDPFSQKQIELVETFAAQAVIAIENTRLLNELRQSLEQQTATSEVLSVISSSPGELGPVFQAMLENATRICDANFGNLLLHDGNDFQVRAMHNAPPAWNELRQRSPTVHPGPNHPLARMAATKQFQHTIDLTADVSYLERDPALVPIVDLAGARTALVVPMLKDDVLVGAIVIYRQEVRPFTEKQIELVQNFAAQAVIAIENTRLLNELRQRTTDLTESLEQQTATSGVLSVISSSPGELAPVFQAMLANATRICEAKFGTLYVFEDNGFRRVAMHNGPAAYAEARPGDRVLRPPADVPLGRIVITKRAEQVADVRTTRAFIDGNPFVVSAVHLGGYRTVLAVPMLKDNKLIGAIVIHHQEVRAFTDKQITLVENFAAQAVIAIENTRLLNELRQSLEQQTATSEVLSVISSSPGELEPVFQSMLQNATHICEAKFGTLFRFDGLAYHLAAQFGTPPELAEFQRRRGPFQTQSDGLLDQMMRTKQVRHTADEAAEPLPGKAATLGGARSTVYVPLLKDEMLIGAIVIYRQEVRPFTDKQIELVRNFAAQAVIAIENTRLLNELREVARTANGNLSSAERYLKLTGRT